jgi:hypothetical protein
MSDKKYGVEELKKAVLQQLKVELLKLQELEKSALAKEEAAPAMPVGSGTSTPPGQLDLCPVCKKEDKPGACECMSYDMEKGCWKSSEPVEKSSETYTEKAIDVTTISNEHKTIGKVGVLPGDKKSKVEEAPGSGGELVKEEEAVNKGDYGMGEKGKPLTSPQPAAPKPAAAPKPQYTMQNYKDAKASIAAAKPPKK